MQNPSWSAAHKFGVNGFLQILGAVLIILIGAAAPTRVVGDAPGVLNYQGRITVASSVFNGAGLFKFALVNSNASTTYWLNAPSTAKPGQPDQAISVQVVRGLYTVNLGDPALPNMAPLPTSIFAGGIGSITTDPLFLRVWFSDGTNSFEQLTPDQRLTAVGFAMASAYAQRAGSVADGSIGLNQLASGLLNVSNFSGTLPLGLLPTNVVLKTPDLDGLSNALTMQFALQLTALSNRLSTNFTASQSNLISGLTAVSLDPADPKLSALGFVPFYSLASADWSNGNAGGPNARILQASVWVGQQWMIWGGSLSLTMSAASLSASGGLYSPSSDSWTPISPSPSLSARTGHTLIWDGNEAIAWGGVSASGVENSGASFTPATLSWSPLPTSGAPVKRTAHVAVWSGKYMTLWGGANPSGLLNDGGLYDPIGQVWTPLNVPGTPTPRSGAVAVWAGDRMIVWGGQGTNGLQNTGAQLLFDTNGVPTGWAATSTSNAPPGRVGHTAVWTGHQMLVWGGLVGGSPAGDGAAYDPIADQWTPLSMTQAPAARSGHAAVWTGREMLILGGHAGGLDFASGYAYDPASDTWRPLSTTGGPIARTGSSAVWTGTNVLVFAGQSGSDLLADLQILNPQAPWNFYRKP